MHGATPDPAPRSPSDSNYEGDSCDVKTGGSSSGGYRGGGGSSCMAPGTLVLVVDDETTGTGRNAVPVEHIKLGDVLVGGGRVLTTMQGFGDVEELYDIESNANMCRDSMPLGIRKDAFGNLFLTAACKGACRWCGGWCEWPEGTCEWCRATVSGYVRVVWWPK